jgi:LysR family nitrogen assimilation transcriptional regulator
VDVRQIRDFIAVVRSSSFAAASRNLGVSQPGLGYQVKQLEEELQVRLLRRHARGVSLTRAGEAFMDHAESILAAIANAKLAMAAIANDDRHKIRVGLAPSLQALGPLLLTSPRQNPAKIWLKEAHPLELHQELLEGGLDVAICLSTGKPPLRTMPIYSEPLYVVGPRMDIAPQPKRIALAELAVLPLVLGCRAQTARRLLDDAVAAAGIKLTIDQEVESQALLRSLVLHSGRFTIAPYGAFVEEIENKLLSVRRIVGPGFRQSVNAIYPASLPAAVEKSVGQIVQSILNAAPLPPDAINLASIAAE